jgi:hypothetical protein
MSVRSGSSRERPRAVLLLLLIFSAATVVAAAASRVGAHPPA